MNLIYVSIVFSFVTVSTVDSLECYSCSDASNINSCTATTQCQTGQSCFTNSHTSGQDTTYTLGCIANEQCGIQSGIIGRDVSERETPCHECCSTERCNSQLCIHFKPTTCMDDLKVDCAYLNAMFNICKDIQHSKNVCPKFCGLCTLVDGNWAEWSQWSACDVTCEKGIQTRKRTCTNPPPANKGVDCVGNDTETKQCLKQPCPIHGGWTDWAPWGTCSVTCDVGIQKRARNCSNPYPSRFGNHCFGDPFDARICMQGQCANGGWATWGTWSTCTATCDGGLRSRFRSCTNPLPSTHGRFCVGQTSEVEECNKQQCDSGVTVFLAHALNSYSVSNGQRFVFITTLVNVGGAYSNSTGYFTTPINGSYSFSYQFCLQTGKHIYVNIMVNSTVYSASHYYEANANSCNTAKIFVYLKKGDKVWIRCNSVTSGTQLYENSQYMNSFSGILVRT